MRPRSRRLIGPPSRAVLALIITAAALPIFVSPAQASTVGGPQPPGSSSAADAVGESITDLAESEAALGVYFDDVTSQFVVVAPISGPGSTITAADFSSINAPLRVETRDITQETADTINQSIQQRAWHPDAGLYSYGSFLDLQSGIMQVQTDAPSDVMAPLLAEFPGLLEYQSGPAGRDTRQNDPAPHWGGASITNGTSICSSGFSVQDGTGTRFMVTAGHCFAAGAAVRSTGGGQAFGTVVNRAPFPVWDLELLGGDTYGSFIYVGAAAGVPSHVIDAGNPVVDFTGYCRSGQTTFEQCGQRVTSLNAQFCDASGCTPNLISYDTGGLSAGGDSGAPFYLPDTNGVHIRGVHIARTGGTMYAEKWSQVSAIFGGVTIVS